MSQDPPPFRFLRCLLAAVSGFLFALAFFAFLDARQEFAVQEWDAKGMGWLKFEYWSRAAFWKEAFAGGALTLVLALLGETLRRWSNPLVGLIRWGTGTFGHPLGLLLMVAVALAPQGLKMATRPAAPEDSPNILFIMVDTWRSDRTSFLGYERETWPEVGELAKEGLLFERAVAQAPWTRPSVASLFTSLMPSYHGAMSHMPADSGRLFVNLERDHTTIAESLAMAGYDTLAISNNANVVRFFGLGQGFEDFRKYSWEVDAGDMAAEMEEWMSDHDPSRPFFCYLHVTDPHHPYDAPEPFRGMWDKVEDKSFNLSSQVVKDFHHGKFTPSDEQMQHLRDAYDEEQRYTDSALAPFIRRVREKYPDTVIVLVGDHGEEFLEHGTLGHGHVLYDELTWVPLIFWVPGFEGRRIKTQVPLLDVAPTLLELSKVAAPIAEAQGQSLMPVFRQEEVDDRPAPMETGGDGEPPWQLRGLVGRVDGRLWKLIREEISPINPDEVKLQLFDIEADPLEKQNLAAEFPEVAQTLLQTMKDRGWYVHPDDLEGEMWSGGAGADALKADLAALGYLDNEEAGEEEEDRDEDPNRNESDG